MTDHYILHINQPHLLKNEVERKFQFLQALTDIVDVLWDS